ncbi:MAG: hypothetical protein MJZ37_08175 [Bacilli bacterium]|nr:hypothetical protein [Bacilli bacterium]
MGSKVDKELEDAEKSVMQIIDDVCNDICNGYCKWTERYGGSDDDLDRIYEDHCNKCPLNKLNKLG